MEEKEPKAIVLDESPRRLIDVEAAQSAVGDLLSALGFDWQNDDHLSETPLRVVKSFQEQLSFEEVALTTFPNEGYDELVIAKDISFHSLCAHHLLPFEGVAHVGYIPDTRIIGLSKLARVVDLFAHRLQVQERITYQVAHWLQTNLQPKGVGVVIEAEHCCMTIRGVKKPGSAAITSTLLGSIRNDLKTREEFLALIRGGVR
ncbi:MAG: GTP cyclohydrolase I FolE [Actinomycetota bacterium]|nr:GTP cyclohydrolase I FolE [Actinomycetota bacterium]